MKLLQINSTYNWGSTGHIAEEIGQKFLKVGKAIWLMGVAIIKVYQYL